MKKIIFLIFLNIVATTYASEDIPAEFQNYHTKKWPQFLVNFYNAIQETLYDVKENITSIPQAVYFKFIGKHPHAEEQAIVRFSENDDISDIEKEFIKQRLKFVKENLEKEFNISLDENKIPRIGLIFSGGGFRAMITTLGFLCGAQTIGLLDNTLYCTGLSGSTWALAPWIASKKPLLQFTKELTNKLSYGIDHIDTPYELSELLEIFVTKLLCGQFISTMDIYGNVIVNTLLRDLIDKPMLIRMTESHAHILNGSAPLPIYTAIQTHRDPYEWMEFTPFEVGSSYLKSYVPTWAYGRSFSGGSSHDYAPEQTLGYFLGIFGSAFEVNLKDIVRMSATNLSYYGHQLPGILAGALKKCLRLILDSFLGEMRLFPSMLSNFTYLCEQSPICDEKTIPLVDAGIDFNLPFPPLLRPARNMDILIVYDASADIENAPELRRAERYAQRNGLKFPPINYEIVDKQPVSIFKDTEDPQVPMVIYFPRIKNINYSMEFDPEYCIEGDYCNTFNFSYKPEEAKLLCGFAEFALHEQQELIKQSIQDVLVEKYGYAMTTPSTEAMEIVA
ncbi:MAG: hypothetical protein WDZ41_05370 [Candidatus Babeliales bacterium]